MKTILIQAGYTVHAPDDVRDTSAIVNATWAFCIDGDYTEGFNSEEDAWEAAERDYFKMNNFVWKG